MSVASLLAEHAMAADGGWPSWQSDRARGIPGVTRATQVYTSVIGSLPLDRFRGTEMLPPAPMMVRPDPGRSLEWWLGRHVDDYLTHGNAVHLITNRDSSGWPSSGVWLPAQRVTMVQDPDRPLARAGYEFDGRALPADDVVHVQRGADPMFPWRGVGVVEQHVRSLSRLYAQEAQEAGNLQLSGVPSVAVVAPNPRLSSTEIDAAREQWDAMFGGPVRRPGIFPGGTTITPLAWSPTDAQMVEARQFGLTDVANMFNLDSYWLSAPASSHTYRSPGPMFTALLNVSLGPVIREFQAEWGFRWLPHGQNLMFARRSVEIGGFAEATDTVAKGVTTVDGEGRALLSVEEGRALLGLSTPTSTDSSAVSPLPVQGGGI